MSSRWLCLLLVAACDREDPREALMVPERPALAPVMLELAIDVADGLSGPEAIIQDDEADVYLVSNLHGSPHAADDNGFISRISPDGSVIVRKWIDGASPDVTLHAPRGMAIAGDTLYVVDLDAVRLFDRVTGAPKGDWPVPNPQFPNDIRVDPEGHVLVTETAIRLLPTGPVPSGTSTIWKFSPDGAATPFARGDELGGPNGISITKTGVVLASFMDDEVYRIVNGRKEVLATLPATQLDGLVQLPDDSFLVTSWKPRAIWRVFPDGTYRQELGDFTYVGAASIDYDAGRGRVLVPLVLANQLRFEPFHHIPLEKNP